MSVGYRGLVHYCSVCEISHPDLGMGDRRGAKYAKLEGTLPKVGINKA